MEPITFSRRHSTCSLALLEATSEDALVEALEDVSGMRMLVQAARLLRTQVNRRLGSKSRIKPILCFFEGWVLLDECFIAGSDAVPSVLCAVHKKRRMSEAAQS